MPLEHNLLIEAGAGTGKTTRLVKAILQVLFIRQIPLEGIVALTFTNKAAGELKRACRLGFRRGRARVGIHRSIFIKKPWWPTPEPALALSDLQELALKATQVLDRADISTIHSFAFALLKRFPLASGIDPNASIDDKGLRFDDLFRREWPQWLWPVSWGETPPREKNVARSALQALAGRSSERPPGICPILKPAARAAHGVRDGNLQNRLAQLHADVRELAAAHPGAQKADDIARACEEVIGIAAHGAWEKLEDLSPETIASLEKKPGDPTKAWTEEDLDQPPDLFLAIATNLRKRGDRVIGLLTETIAPFIARFRDVLLARRLPDAFRAAFSIARNRQKSSGDPHDALKRPHPSHLDR